MWHQQLNKRFVGWWVLCLAYALAICYPMEAQSVIPSPNSQDWQNKYEILQSGVLRIVPQLESELRTAQQALEQSQVDKLTSDKTLEQLQADSNASALERQTLIEQSKLHETEIFNQSKRIEELTLQLDALLTLWQSSESSRQTLEQAATVALDKANQEAGKRHDVENSTIWVGVGGIIIGVGVTLLIINVAGGH